MRYKDRTPDTQAIRGRFAEFKAKRTDLCDAPKREPFPLSQDQIDRHFTLARAQLPKLGYVCGTFHRAADRVSNWPSRWYLSWHTTDHPPRVCRGQRKKRRRRA